MALTNVLWLVIFWAMQIVAALAFKYGSTAPSRWLTGFILGNAVGASSIWFMMLLYRAMNPNIAMGIAVGGSFLLTQIALALVFRSSLSLTQYFGLTAMVAGMMALAMGGKG